MAGLLAQTQTVVQIIVVYVSHIGHSELDMPLEFSLLVFLLLVGLIGACVFCVFSGLQVLVFCPRSAGLHLLMTRTNREMVPNFYVTSSLSPPAVHVVAV